MNIDTDNNKGGESEDKVECSLSLIDHSWDSDSIFQYIKGGKKEGRIHLTDTLRRASERQTVIKYIGRWSMSRPKQTIERRPELMNTELQGFNLQTWHDYSKASSLVS